jgi:hypothetical protein
MLTVIFAACLLTTVVSIFYAVVQLGPGGPLEGVTVQVEVRFSSVISNMSCMTFLQAATSLLVANVGVLVTSAYRFFYKSDDDMDAKPYTYNYSIHGNGNAQTSNGSQYLKSTETMDEEKSTDGNIYRN